MPSELETRIGFEPVEPAHYVLLGGWLAAPHTREWWGDPEEELGFIREMVEGRDTTRPYLIMLDGEPVGYIQVWFIDHQNGKWIEEYPWLTQLPQQAVGVDLSLGESDRLSKGIGSAALRKFVAWLRAQGHYTIVIDPDPANVRAVRAYEKAGFAPIASLLGRTGNDVLIMQHHLKAIE